MKIHLQIVLITLSILGNSHADILKLKDGTVLNGKYVGGTSGSVQFETTEGLLVYDSSQVAGLTITNQATAQTVKEPAGAATKTNNAATAQIAKASTVTIPSGTDLLVRLMDNVSSQGPSGQTFTTRLEYDLNINGVTALKAGTPIYGTVMSEQAGRLRGKSSIDLSLNRIVADGQQVPIATGGHHAASEASIRKAAKGAAGGAIIGGIAGDAGKGAAIGSAVGAVVKPKSVGISSGTLLEFTLTQPVVVQTK